MKLESISPLLLKKADELIKNNHPFLHGDDEIYFLGEYTVGALSEHSKTNRLIFNFKKPLERKSFPDWNYKEQAIQEAAALFRTSIFNTEGISERAHRATLVPIPPSMSKNSPEYDDRILKMLHLFMPEGDIRELILQKDSRPALHSSKSSYRNPQDLASNYFLNSIVRHPQPKEIWLFDDVLTKGTHFRALHEFLSKEFPQIPIVGFFIARTILKTVSSPYTPF
jgi:hypothetical protein